MSQLGEPVPVLATLRRYAHAYVNVHDFDVCSAIMHDDYVLHMGNDVLAGRDTAYVPAVRHQFSQFPTLSFAVHEVVTDGNYAALIFTEYGTSERTGRQAAWMGVSIYRWADGKLAECWVEQDYYSRRRQLDLGIPARLEPLAFDPWGTSVASPSARTDEVLRRWLGDLRHWPPEIGDFNPGAHSAEALTLDVESCEVNVLFTAETRAAFHVSLRGIYLGGLPGIPTGKLVETHAAGIALVDGDSVLRVRGVDARLAVQRALQSTGDAAGR